jgi:hypothetical protein
VPSIICTKIRSERSDNDASKPSTGDSIWCFRQALHTQENCRDHEKGMKKTSLLLQNAIDNSLHKMSDVLLYLSTVQAVRPTCHWWRCPRVFAWCRVRMVWSLVQPPVSAGPLSRRGDYLLAARGPGLFLGAVCSQQHQGDYG